MKSRKRPQSKKQRRKHQKSKKKKVELNVGFMKLPNSKHNLTVNVLNKKMESETDFGGYPLDLLFGIIYLKRKHPTLLSLPFDIKELLITYSNDLQDRYPFTFVGCILFKCHEELIQQDKYSNKNYKFDTRDFEIELPGKVSISEFKKVLDIAKKRNKRFTIIPLILRWSCEYEFEGHANLIIFDFEKKTVERFEPYGFISTFTKEEDSVSLAFNNEFTKILKKLDSSLKYVDQSVLLRKGPQYIEENQIQKVKLLSNKSDPEGFCGAWSLWYADLRLSHPEKEPRELIEMAIESISETKKLRQFIRNYSSFLVNERYSFLKKIKQKNPYNHILGDQILSLKDKKTTIAGLLKTSKILSDANK